MMIFSTQGMTSIPQEGEIAHIGIYAGICRYSGKHLIVLEITHRF